MAYVTLPSGCVGLDGSRSKTPTVKQGSSVEISDATARSIKRGWYGQSGVISPTVHGFGTKTGRWCPPCNFLAQAWSKTCPRCGGKTISEDEMPAQPVSPLPAGCFPVAGLQDDKQGASQ